MSSTCCGNSVQKGAKIIAIFQIVSISTITLLVCGLLIFNSIEYNYNYGYNSSLASDTFIFVFLVLLVGSIQCAISYVLYTGAKKLSLRRLNIWLVFNIFVLILGVYNLVSEAHSFKIGIFIAKMLSLGIQIWFIAVVYELRAEIQETRLLVVYSQPKDQQDLTAAIAEP